MLARSMCRVVCSVVALFAAYAAAAAQVEYPTKPIRLIIPFPPGGSADPLGRAFANWFAERFDVPVVADNRPGAGTAIAHTLAARSEPDGYTLVLGASSGMTTNPAFGSKLDYHPIKDFTPVGLAAYVPQLLVVHPSVPAKGVAEFIELAKAQPGKINIGSPGAGSVGHLSVELLNAMSGARFTHVPYKGAGPGMIDLLSNRIQGFVGSVTGTRPHILAGKIRALASGHLQRLRSMPELPTIGEVLPGFTNNGWYGIFAPAGTSAAIVDKLNAEMQRALANAEFSKHIETIGMEPAGGTPKELGDWLESELARWTKVVRDAGIGVRAN